MEYAVIKTGGKQYRVKAGDVLDVDKLVADKEVVFGDVLLYVLNGTVKIGTPTVSGMSVKAKVLEQHKGEKIRVAKFKSKVRYRRVTGFRALLTKVQIEKIELAKAEKPAAKKKTS